MPFNLETAIAAWRRPYEVNRAFSAEDIEELESNLRDRIEALLRGGHSEEQAFRMALRRMGSFNQADSEYRKVYWGKLIRTRRVRTELEARGAMLVNHIKVAARSIRRYPGYFFINGIGLAFGVACCLLIGLYVLNEATFDRFHENAERIYRVNGTSRNPEGDFYRTRVPAPLASIVRDEYPEVQATVRLMPTAPKMVVNGDQKILEEGLYLTESDFFDVFSFQLLEGDTATALSNPGSVVLSESAVRQYFGDAEALGRTITVEDSLDLTVTGVLADAPRNSHLQFRLLASLDTPSLAARDNWRDDWGRASTYTYVLLHSSMDAETVEPRLTSIVDDYMAGSLDESEEFSFSLQPLPRIHFHPHVAPEEVRSASTLQYVYLLSAIGLFVLVIACVNYVNLAVSTSARRVREVGVRKTLGSDRRQLVAQFLGESVLVSVLAVIAACVMVVGLLPVFNDVSGMELHLGSLVRGAVGIGLFGLWMALGFGAGVYPAFVLSRAVPVTAMRGGTLNPSSRSAPLRNGLLIVQFVAAIMLVVGTLVVDKQLAFMRQIDLGYEKEHVLLVTVRDSDVWENQTALKDELQTISGVREVTFSSGTPNAVGYQGTAEFQRDGQDVGLEFPHIMVDYDFAEVFGLDMAEGRFFSRKNPGDESTGYVLNEAGIRAIGWDDALGKPFTLWGTEGTVIGVVSDFNFESLHRPIGPLALHFGPRWYSTISVKTAPVGITETVEQIGTTMRRFSPGWPFEYTFLDQTFDLTYRAEERFGRLSAYFTAIAVLLACLGLVGLTASVVERRRKEIGIRKALGATSAGVVVLLTREYMRPVLLACAIAIPVSYFIVRWWLDDFAYRIDIGSGVFLLAVSTTVLLAVATISLRAMKTAGANPVSSLRSE